MSVAREFTVGDHTYSASRMDAFTQLHVGRRLSPMLSYVTAEGGTFSAIVEVLRAAPQEDVDFIIRSALKIIKRRSGDGWAPIYNTSADQLVFDDIDGLQLLQIVGNAIEGDIAPFFSGLVKLVFDTDQLTKVFSQIQKTSS